MPFFSKAFRSDIYIDYPQEKVKFYYSHTTKTVFRKFYEENFEEIIPFSNELFNEAIRLGEPITKEQYKQGSSDTDLTKSINNLKYTLLDNKSSLEVKGKIISLPFEIIKMVACENVLAVLVLPPKEIIYNQNIFGLNESGIIWQVEKISDTKSDRCYQTIEFKDKILRAWDWIGCLDFIDHKNGKITGSEFVK